MLTSLGLEEPNTPQPTSIWATDSIHGALSHCGQGIGPWGLCRGQQRVELSEVERRILNARSGSTISHCGT